MSNNKRKNSGLPQPLRHENHGKPRTRREFMAQGFLGMSGFVMTPGILELLVSNPAFAATCVAPGSSDNVGRMAGFLVFDLAGGAGIAGSNVIVGKRGGQMDFINSYSSLGLPAGMQPARPGQINTELGLAFHADSAILRGIQSTTSATTRANMDGVVFCAASNDDTGNNPHNPVYWINKAGAKGELTALVGTSNSVSGGNSRAPGISIDPTKRPVRINRSTDVLQLVNPGKLATLLSTADVNRIMKAAQSMSSSKLAMFQEKDLPSQIKELVECGYIQSSEMLTRFNVASLDPRLDPLVTATFNNLNNADQQKTAAVTKLILDGTVGAGTVTKGGYDYHDGTRRTGEIRDFEAGALMGRAFELAARKGQDLMIYVFTDGAVASNGSLDNSADGRGKGVWTADSGQRAATFALVYKRDGKPTMRNERRQVGAFRDGGGVDIGASRLSNNVDTLAKAVVANYLALHGLEGKLADVVGDNPFGAEFEQYLAFNKLR